MLMYLIMRVLVMDGHASLSMSSLSLLYRIVNVLYIWTLFLLLNTFCHEWSRLETLCQELLYILGFDLYTVSMTVVDAPNTNSHFLTIHNPWSPFEFTRSN
jgi:hypothetical protein